MRTTLLVLIFSLIVMIAPRTARAAVHHRHVPPAEAPPRQPLALTVDLERGWDVDMELRFRTPGMDSWQVVPFGRSQEETYTATIPAEYVEPPGLEYFIVHRKNSAPDAPLFASKNHPHRVRIEEEAGVTLRQRILGHHRNHRAGIHMRSEWFDYGGTRGASYKLEGTVNYLLLALPLKTIRFAYAQQFGNAAHIANWFVLGLAHGDVVEFDLGAAFVLAGGFKGGGRAELRIGVEQGTHIALGGEYIQKRHAIGRFRLAWATVPGFPMAASVEIDAYPREDADNDEDNKDPYVGVRLIYDLTRTFDNGFVAGLRLSYQGDKHIAAGASVGYEF